MPPADPSVPSSQRQISKYQHFFWLFFWLFSFGVFSWMHVLLIATESLLWLLTQVQGGCLEPKWQWPFWHSTAHPLTHSCVHPNGGVVGDCGSANPSDINRYQQKRVRVAVWAQKCENPLFCGVFASGSYFIALKTGVQRSILGICRGPLLPRKHYKQGVSEPQNGSAGGLRRRPREPGLGFYSSLQTY